jgi:hypothetical protein
MGWGQLLGGAAGFFLGGPAGALAGAALGGGLDEATGGGQTGAAREAAQIANASSDRALALQQRMYDEGVARLQPRLTAGNNALAQMQSGAFAQPAAFSYDPSKYTQSAANAFLTEAGNRNVRAQLAAQGRMFSGGALKAISDYNRNAASVGEKEYYQRALDEYNARVAQSNTGYNRLAGLADVGQTAGTQIGTAGQNYATNAGNLMTNQGYNTGNAYLAGERARQSSYGEIGKALGSGGFGSLQTGFNNMFGARQPASSASRYMPSGGYDPYLPYGYYS